MNKRVKLRADAASDVLNGAAPCAAASEHGLDEILILNDCQLICLAIERLQIESDFDSLEIEFAGIRFRAPRCRLSVSPRNWLITSASAQTLLLAEAVCRRWLEVPATSADRRLFRDDIKEFVEVFDLVVSERLLIYIDAYGHNLRVGEAGPELRIGF